MAEERLKPDANFAKVIGGVTDDANEEVRQLKMNPTNDRAKVDALITDNDAETTEVDDDNIAKSQVVPFRLNIPYIFSKTEDAWIRQQGSDDGYAFVRTIGNFDSDGHELDINSDGSINTIVMSADDFEGGPVTVGTTAVEITFTGTTKSVFLQSDQDNAGEVYIGKSNVTNAGANAMCRLSAGESITIEMDDSSNAVYVVATQADQKVYKFALLT